MFRSFFLAGFECATGYNKNGEWIDQVTATGHDVHVFEDYARLAEVGIHAARESVRWSLVDQGHGQYDFSTVAPFVRAARENNVEVIWDLFHYGYPRELDPFSDEFTSRFADYCHAAAKYLAARTDGACYFTPVNEPSFFAYAGGEAGQFAPHVTGRGWDLKVALCRAAIAGIEAIWAACPGARIVNADPLCHVVTYPGQPAHEVEEAHDFNERLVWQSWDMLCGRLEPGLGGSREHLDIVGINYYWTNQWVWRVPAEEWGPTGHWIPPLGEDDPRRLPLRDLIKAAYDRYGGGDILISETSHVGDGRAAWLRTVAEESEALLKAGVPLRGVCLYPILGMPEWHAPDTWAHMGLWDPHPETAHGRVAHAPMLDALQASRHLDELHAELTGLADDEHAAGTGAAKAPLRVAR